MLPKEKRLTNTRDYKRVYQKGLFFSAPLFNVCALPNRMDLTRVGIVVNKKVAAKAVERNKAKRQIREAVHKLYNNLPKGYDLVITSKDKTIKATYAEIEKEITGIIERIKK